MTTHITKTWFNGKNIVTQEIPVQEVYRREWVGLTDEDKDEIIRVTESDHYHDILMLAEAKLKEKNT